jgi:hypothetical protein
MLDLIHKHELCVRGICPNLFINTVVFPILFCWFPCTSISLHKIFCPNVRSCYVRWVYSVGGRTWPYRLTTCAVWPCCQTKNVLHCNIIEGICWERNYCVSATDNVVCYFPDSCFLIGYRTECHLINMYTT